MLTPFVPDQIWTEEQPCRFYGIPMGARMTVLRLRSGELWVHSPLDLDEPLRRQIDGLGPVRFIIAPSRLHYLCVNSFRSQYPDALVFGSPKLVRHRSDIAFTAALGDEPEAGWAGQIDQIVVRGRGFWDEVVFCHRDTGTLIVADLLESAHPDSPWLMRVFGHLSGIFEKPGPPLDMKWLLRRWAEAHDTIARIAAWEFDRIVLSHGHLIPSGGKAVFRRAYQFLLDR